MNTSGERQQESGAADGTMSSYQLSRRDLFTKTLVAGIGVLGLGFLDELPAYAAALDPENPLALGNTLHLCGLAESGIIWHTIRLANGSWQSSFGNVNAQESNGNLLRFQDVDCSGIDRTLHVCGLGTGGIIWHTIRHADGSWQSSFGNVNAQESNGSLRFTDISCATVGGDLHIAALGTDGQIWHTIRFASGSWQSSFGNVNAQESNSSLRFVAVDCANVSGDLQVGGVARNHIIWHTIRFSSNGSWQSSFGNVNAQESNGNLRFTDIGLGGVVG